MRINILAVTAAAATLAAALPAPAPLAARADPQPIVASLTPIRGSTFRRTGRTSHRNFALAERQTASTLGDRSDVRYLLSLIIDGVTLPLMVSCLSNMRSVFLIKSHFLARYWLE